MTGPVCQVLILCVSLADIESCLRPRPEAQQAIQLVYFISYGSLVLLWGYRIGFTVPALAGLVLLGHGAVSLGTACLQDRDLGTTLAYPGFLLCCGGMALWTTAFWLPSVETHQLALSGVDESWAAGATSVDL